MKKNIEPKAVYELKRDAQRFALQLLNRGLTVKLTKVRGGWSVGVY